MSCSIEKCNNRMVRERLKIRRLCAAGDRAVDFRNAWKKMGINYKDGEVLMKELEMTWHHVEDLDINMNSTLQLVTRKAHRITIPHSGSVKESDILYDYINNNL